MCTVRSEPHAARRAGTGIIRDNRVRRHLCPHGRWMRPRVPTVNPFRRVIEHVYLTSAGGVPLVHLSGRVNQDKDPDLIASMFTALQNFMDDSFHDVGIGKVRSIEVGRRHHVAFGRGRWVLLYVVYRGRESNRLERRIDELVTEIEARYADLLKDWDGDMDEVRGVRTFLEREWAVPSREPLPALVAR